MGATLLQLDRHRRRSEHDGLHTFDLPNNAKESIEKTITVRVANCEGERNTANMLISRKYSGRGYGANHRVPTSSTCVTFTASSNNSLVGTLSLTVDSADGLACDKTFKEELDAFRGVPGVKLFEMTKFAFDTSKSSLQLLASFIHIIFIYETHHYSCTDVVIEVNPRHRRFYRTMLGFKEVATPRINEAVGAPSHLMALKLSEMRRLIDQHKRNPSVAGHSLYGYFFSEKEEIGIYNRLASPIVEPTPLNRVAADMGKVRRNMVPAERRSVATRQAPVLEPALA